MKFHIKFCVHKIDCSKFMKMMLKEEDIMEVTTMESLRISEKDLRPHVINVVTFLQGWAQDSTFQVSFGKKYGKVS